MLTFEQLNQLNDIESELYSYILKHLGEVKEMSIRELAQATHMSSSTIFRFCRKIGYNGFAQFKEEFLPAEDDQAVLSDVEIEIQSQTLARFFELTHSQDYQEKIKQAKDIVAASDEVIFIGLGNGISLAQYGARFFSNVGVYSSFIGDPFYPAPAKTNKQGVLIVLSVSGSKEMILLQTARYRKANFKVIAITSKEHSGLAKMSDVVLSYQAPIKLLDERYNINTQVPVIGIIEQLGLSLINANNFHDFS